MVRYNIYDPVVEDEDLIRQLEEDCEADLEASKSPSPPHLSREEINNLTYKDGIRLIRDVYNGSTADLRDLDDVKEYLLLKCFPSNDRDEKLFKDIEERIQACHVKQRELWDVCGLIQEKLIDTHHVSDIDDIVNCLEPDLREKWKDRVGNLRETMNASETAILNAGETGSGKSSLINLLIGKKILPIAEHPSTATICTIRSSEEEFVKLWDNRCESPRIFPHLSSERIEFFITARDVDGDPMARKAEFYCRMPVLKSSAYFVDTPGFREHPTLSDLLKKHLSKAAAFVIVMRTDDYTGLNQSVKDFIILVKNELDALSIGNRDGNHMSIVLPNLSEESVIFVFNRWDEVVAGRSPKDVRRIRKKCLNYLGTLWDKVEENKNVFFMSVKKIQSLIHETNSCPQEYVDFQKALYNMIPRCLTFRFKAAHRWLHHLNGSLLAIIRKKINNVRKDDAVKKLEEHELKDLLSETKITASRKNEDLSKQLKEKKSDLQKQLIEHIKSNDVLARMSDFYNDEVNYKPMKLKTPASLPNCQDVDDLRSELEIFTMRRIANEISFWNVKDAYYFDENSQKNILDKTKTKFQTFLDDIKAISLNTFDIIEKKVQLINELLDYDSFLPEFDELPESSPKSEFLSNLEKAFFGMTAIIWIPLVLVGGAVGLPVIAGFMASDKINNRNLVHKYQDNQEELTIAYVKSFVTKHFNKDVLDYIIHEPVLQYADTVMNRMERYLPLAMETFENLITNIHEKRSLQDVMTIFDPIREDIEVILSHLYHFGARHIKNYEFSIQNLVGSDMTKMPESEKDLYSCFKGNTRNYGAFGKVFITYYEKLKRLVAVKVIPEAISQDNAFRIFNEESTWRKLNSGGHPKIVELYGLVAYGENEKKVGFVMEACDCTLEQLLQQNSSLVPFRQTNIKDKQRAFHELIVIASDIIDALAYIHKMKIVHRNLRIDNILIKTSQSKHGLSRRRYPPKLVDFGYSKGHSQVTATVCNNTPNASPEEKDRKGWTKAADIYSFGIILWEMYHNKRVDSYTISSNDSEDTIASNARDIHFEYPDGFTPQIFCDIVANCTDPESVKRKKAMDVKADLDTLLSSPKIVYKNMRKKPKTNSSTPMTKDTTSKDSSNSRGTGTPNSSRETPSTTGIADSSVLTSRDSTSTGNENANPSKDTVSTSTQSSESSRETGATSNDVEEISKDSCTTPTSTFDSRQESASTTDSTTSSGGSVSAPKNATKSPESTPTASIDDVYSRVTI